MQIISLAINNVMRLSAVDESGKVSVVIEDGHVASDNQ